MSFYWRWVVVRTAVVALCAIHFACTFFYALVSGIGVVRLKPKPELIP